MHETTQMLILVRKRVENKERVRDSVAPGPTCRVILDCFREIIPIS